MTGSTSALWRLLLVLAAFFVAASACTVDVTLTTTIDDHNSRGDELADENCDPGDCYDDRGFDSAGGLDEGDFENDPTDEAAVDDPADAATIDSDPANDDPIATNPLDGGTANASGEDRAAGDASTALTGGGIDLSLDRDDIDCSDDGLGSDDTVSFVVAHVVVDGDLGALCFGDTDATLISSWETLAAITPPGQLRDLGLFGGFVAGNEDDGTTLAFVNTLDDAGSLFQMSVNLDEAEADPEELMLTMAHEFSHVFTATSAEIDRSAGARGCDTYYNGEGCYEPTSLIAEWVDLFWGDGLVDEIDPDSDATVSSGEDRCAINPAFFGSYAASNPEEDFAEAFSAYVFRLGVDSPGQQEKLDWFAAQPGLAEFRQRALDAEFGPLNNNFDRCG